MYTGKNSPNKSSYSRIIKHSILMFWYLIYILCNLLLKKCYKGYGTRSLPKNCSLMLNSRSRYTFWLRCLNDFPLVHLCFGTIVCIFLSNNEWKRHLCTFQFEIFGKTSLSPTYSVILLNMGDHLKSHNSRWQNEWTNGRYMGIYIYIYY